jgi:hypothetical protein
MSTRIGFLKLATLVAIAAAGLAPAAAQAQSDRGQLVQAVAKLNQAQLSFVKKLADDPQYSSQFDAAASAGNYDAAASLVASATGLAKSSIWVGPKGGRGDDHDGASAATMPTTVFHVASFTPRETKRTGAISGKVCFSVWGVNGCIEF